MNNLIGAIVIAAAVSGAIVYNGHQDRLQRQCLAALTTLHTTYTKDSVVRYSIGTMTGRYCAGFPFPKRRGG